MDENTRFRRALKSPIVMLGLCLLAGWAVYHNVIESTMDSTLPGLIASTPESTTEASTILTPSLRTHEEVATQWIHHPTRDPFAPMSVAKWSPPFSDQTATSTPQSPMPRVVSSNNLILKAVAIEAQRRSAVINRQVVYEGEMIEGYQVVSIQLKGVWLQRHGTKQFLTFSTNATS
jgi:hypothetical protein